MIQSIKVFKKGKYHKMNEKEKIISYMAPVISLHNQLMSSSNQL